MADEFAYRRPGGPAYGPVSYQMPSSPDVQEVQRDLAPGVGQHPERVYDAKHREMPDVLSTPMQRGHGVAEMLSSLRVPLKDTDPLMDLKSSRLQSQDLIYRPTDGDLDKPHAGLPATPGRVRRT